MGCHGWVAGIASHERVIPSRSRLVMVEASEYPRHLSSIQQDAVVIVISAKNQLITRKCGEVHHFNSCLKECLKCT